MMILSATTTTPIVPTSPVCYSNAVPFTSSFTGFSTYAASLSGVTNCAYGYITTGAASTCTAGAYPITSFAAAAGAAAVVVLAATCQSCSSGTL